MDICAIRMLRAQPVRLILTVGSVALCVVLMLFLISIYGGVSEGAIEYIRKNKADLWVLQGNSTNIIRGSSILRTGHGVLLKGIPQVESASPILMLLPSVRAGKNVATVCLTGYEVTSGIGGPPKIVAGRSIGTDDEVVLDRAFAAKYRIRVGDTVKIQDDHLLVVGLSSGTNAFVIQYAFVTIEKAKELIGFPGLVTCYLVNIKKGESIPAAINAIREELPGLEVYTHAAFLQNNISEMESGFLTFLYSIAFIGSIVLTAILSLLLSINIIDRRKDFAIMKALGAPKGFLPSLIVQQSILICLAGSALALIFFFPMVSIIERIAPEVSSKSSPEQIVVVVAAVVFIGLVSSFIAMHRLRHIYPLETFS
jgi:putative ABC transport system permease protein